MHIIINKYNHNNNNINNILSFRHIVTRKLRPALFVPKKSQPMFSGDADHRRYRLYLLFSLHRDGVPAEKIRIFVGVKNAF